MDRINLGRLLLRALRHEPGVLGITLNEDGWADFLDVAHCVQQRVGETYHEDLKAVITSLVELERINISDQGIRASYGGSIGRNTLKPEVPTCRLFHGTRVSFFAKIERQGLRSKNRDYVHLTSLCEYAQGIASKWQDGLVLEVEVENAIASGTKFFKATSHVWLAGHIKPDHLTACV